MHEIETNKDGGGVLYTILHVPIKTTVVQIKQEYNFQVIYYIFLYLQNFLKKVS